MKAFKMSLIFKIIAFVGLIAPVLTLIFIKKDVYFIEGETVKLSLGCIFALIFLLLSFLGKLKDLNGILILGIVEVLVYLLKSLVNDLLIIIPCCMAGLILYSMFNAGYKHYHEIYLIQRNAKLDQTARNDLENENKEDLSYLKINRSGRSY